MSDADRKKYLERLARWDSKTDDCLAPLTDKMKASIAELSAYNTRPFPKQFREKKEEASSTKGKKVVEREQKESLEVSGLDLGSRKVENAQQMLSFRQHKDELKNYCSKCDHILEEIDQLVENLENLQSMYQFVSTQTRSLHDACEQSIQEQADLTNQTEAIADRLKYFSTLETIKHKMSGGTLSATGESFVPLLTRIDECISYMEKNAHYKESSVYLVRFKQCLNQALGILKQIVLRILRNATDQASPEKLAAEGAYTAMYGKFKTQAFRVKNIMEQLEPRRLAYPEYGLFIQDSQQFYFDCRAQILQPFVTSTIQKLLKQHTRNHCTLFRSGCSFLVHVCQDEYQLYFEFFTQPNDGLDLLLESLCNSLYEMFRPLIIYMTHMETLAELCNILKVEMLEEHVARKVDQLSAFQVIISQLLEDVQERLVYKAQTYVRRDIESYKPAPGDLAYPDKLMMEMSQTGTDKGEDGKDTKQCM
eukprot:gene11304-12486_t